MRRQGSVWQTCFAIIAAFFILVAGGFAVYGCVRLADDHLHFLSSSSTVVEEDDQDEEQDEQSEDVSEEDETVEEVAA